MKLSTSLVAVRKITSSVPRSNFTDNHLEQAARLILEAEGIINPIVLHRTSVESYEVVDGHFEYYAAARAREIDPRKGEMIGAFIIEDENEEVLKQQVKLLRQQQPTATIPNTSGLNGSELQLINLESRQTNLESRIETRLNELKAEQARNMQKIEDEIQEIRNQFQKRIDPLEAFNSSNESELISKLRMVGIIGKKASKVIEKISSERKKQKFNSLSDVMARVKIKIGKREEKGISSEKMVEIIDSW